jgi:hypothetical protein
MVQGVLYKQTLSNSAAHNSSNTVINWLHEVLFEMNLVNATHALQGHARNRTRTPIVLMSLYSGVTEGAFFSHTHMAPHAHGAIKRAGEQEACLLRLWRGAVHDARHRGRAAHILCTHGGWSLRHVFRGARRAE